MDLDYDMREILHHDAEQIVVRFMCLSNINSNFKRYIGKTIHSLLVARKLSEKFAEHDISTQWQAIQTDFSPENYGLIYNQNIFQESCSKMTQFASCSVTATFKRNIHERKFWRSILKVSFCQGMYVVKLKWSKKFI